MLRSPKLGSNADWPLKNLSYIRLKFLCTALFAFSLWALSLGSAYKNMKKQRDDAREDSRNGAHECCDLHNKLRDTENELYYSNERLQDADNGINDERKEFRDTTQELNDQHLVDEEEIRSLRQHVSNTECDRDEYRRRLDYASRKNQRLEREHQQLQASLVEKDETIKDLQAYKDDAVSAPITTVSSPPIYTQPNGDIELYQPITTPLTLRDTAPEQATANEEDTDARVIELENLRDVHAKCGEDLEKQVAVKDGELAKRDDRINVLEQQNGTLSSEIDGLRTDLGNLRDEHRECSDNLDSQLAKKDGEMSSLNDELEVSRRAHAQCDENSTRQNSRIGELVTANEQLKETLRVRTDELGSLQGRVTELAELKDTHAKCDEDANTQGLEIVRLRNANGSLQDANGKLLKQLQTARDNHEDLSQEHRRVQDRNEQLHQAGRDLQSTSERETQLLKRQIETLNQTVDDQQQSTRTLETSCTTCQKLREALDEVVKDVEMSDDSTRDEMRREITVQVRAELRSQVADDVRRQIRGEVEHEVRQAFQNHYADILTRNSTRIQEQDRLLLKKDAELEKVKNTVDHVACQKKESNMQSTITSLRQDARIAQGRCSRSDGDARHDREQLHHAQTALANLRSELETLKTDQRRAQHINPLQSKLTSCQRELNNMKEDRKKARDNCSIYSNQLSELRKKYKSLENDLTALRERSSLDGDKMMNDGCTEEPVSVQDEQRKTISSLQNEVARLSEELEGRNVRDNAQDHARDDGAARSGNQSLPAEQQWPEGTFPDDQLSAAPAMDRDEAAALDLLRHEADLREARDGKKAAVCIQPAASAGPPVERSEGRSRQSSAPDSDEEADDKSSLPNDGGQESDDELEEGEILDTKLAPKPASKPASKPARKFGRRPARLSTRQPKTGLVLRRVAGKKRERDEYSDGEADDEGGEDRKKVKITMVEDGMHRLKTSGHTSTPAEGDKPQEDKDME